MSWNFLISFGIALGAYLIVASIFVIIKRYKVKNNKDEKKDDNKNVDIDNK